MSWVAKALLCEPPNQVCVGDLAIPEPGPGEVLVRVAYSAISPGTELRCLAGLQPDTPPGPWIPGYSAAGTVIRTGPDCRLEVGTQVYCSGTTKAEAPPMWGGHCSLAIQPENGVYPLPGGVDLLSASFAHLAAIAHRGIRVSRPRIWEKIAILGLGPIGQLSARLFSAEGADVIGLDLSPERVETARKAGIVADRPDGPITTAVRKRFGRGADIVVDATGAPAVVAEAIAAARDKAWDDSPEGGPKIVVQGSYPDDLPIPYQAAFLKEAALLIPRDCQPSDVRTVLQMMSDGRLETSGLASAIVRPGQACTVYRRLTERDPDLLSAVIDWNA